MSYSQRVSDPQQFVLRTLDALHQMNQHLAKLNANLDTLNGHLANLPSAAMIQALGSLGGLFRRR